MFLSTTAVFFDVDFTLIYPGPMFRDSVRQDVEGALRVGMRAVLLHRGDTPPPHGVEPRVPIIRSLRELAGLLIPARDSGGGSSRSTKNALD